jgi:proton glutamate symport protein
MSVRLLKHPLVILASIVAAVLFGQAQKEIALSLNFWGYLYLSLLGMCVVPILLSSVSVSIAKIIRNKEYSTYLVKFFGVFVLLTLLVSALATTLAVATGPGELDEANLKILNSLIADDLVSTDLEIRVNGDDAVEVPKSTFENLFQSMVPRNIFYAMAYDASLQILIFSILFGLTLGSLTGIKGETLITALEGLYDSFTKLVHWLLYLLPFALFAMISAQSAMFGEQLFLATARFVFISVGTLSLICVLCLVGISVFSKKSFVATLRAMQEVIVVALTTRNSLACIPLAMEALDEKLELDRDLTYLLTPLGINLGRFGCVAYYAIAAVFVAELYHVETTVWVCVVITLTACLAGLASAGTTGVLTLSLLVLVLQPLGLPLEAVLVLLIAVDAVIDPFRTLTIVLPNCLAVSILSPRSGVHGVVADRVSA